MGIRIGLFAVFCLSLIFDSPVYANPKTLFYVGAKFPRANLAPINPPYIIHLYGANSINPNDGFFKGSVIEGGTLPNGTGTFPIDYMLWQNAGNLVLTRRFTRADMVAAFNKTENVADPKDYYGHYSMARKMYAVPGGISVDELLSEPLYPDATLLMTALKKIKTNFPDYFVAAFTTTEVWKWMVDGGNDGVDVYMPECYIGQFAALNEGTSYITRFVNASKSLGISSKTVMTFTTTRWSSTDTWVMPPDSLDSWIKLVRKLDPEEPGIGLAPMYGHSAAVTAQVMANRGPYEAVIKKNFFEPSPTAEILSLKAGESVTGVVKVQALGTANAKTNKPVVTYRFFVDNECMQISSVASYDWNTVGYADGSHVLTVHAVDNNFLVGVAQVSVNVGTTGIKGAKLVPIGRSMEYAGSISDIYGRTVKPNSHEPGVYFTRSQKNGKATVRSFVLLGK